MPAVENAISGTAFRPGDVYPSRKGLTVEIGDTDAEGRLVLADALALADADAPDLLIDFATLTGAARVALGPDIPPAFTDDDQLAADLARHAAATADPVWRLPLWRPYAKGLESKIADICSRGPGRLRRLDQRGAVPGALRRAGEELAAPRHLCLERPNPGPAGRKAARRRPCGRSTRCCGSDSSCDSAGRNLARKSQYGE